ncbi:hypothetical protein [Acinetobacter phage P1068]|nr:hypothetical protein [Acinetobacter phage P1068]
MNKYGQDSAVTALDIVSKKLIENIPLTFSDQCVIAVTLIAMANDHGCNATVEYFNKAMENQPIKFHPIIINMINCLPTNEQVSFMEVGSVFCGKDVNGSKEFTSTTRKPRKKEKTYIVKKAGTNDVKIGKSINTKDRINTLSCQSGCKLETLMIIDLNIENAMHKKFSHLRGIGEWFDDSKNEIRDFIKNGEQWVIQKLTSEGII